MDRKTRTVRLLVLALLLLMVVPAQALNLGQLRTGLNAYLNDDNNLLLSSARKDSILNASQWEMAGAFHIYVDTVKQALTVGTRIYAMPSTYAGQIVSVHKLDKSLTEVKRVKTDSIPELKLGTVQYYSTVDRFLITHPEPVIGGDTLLIFYGSLPTEIAADGDDCLLQDRYEEALLMLAASKCWLTADLRPDMAELFWRRYQQTMALFTGRKIQREMQ